MSADDSRPWHRQLGESRKAYHAFCHYRDLPAFGRAMDKAYVLHRTVCQSNNPPLSHSKASPEWKQWKVRWNWDARADAHDAEIAEQDLQARAREIGAMNARHAALAMALLNQVLGKLQKLVEQNQTLELTPGQMIVWADKASVIERRARGQATEILQHKEGPEAGTPLDLSKLNDFELAMFEKLTQKACASIG